MMEPLNLPAYPFKIKATGKGKQIFDAVRRKYVTLTPEEWVRQNYIEFLVAEKGVPRSLIAVEMGLKYHRLNKRSDIVVHDNLGNPIVIVECKATQIRIKQETFDQIARYNMALKVRYLVVTNGLEHFYCEVDIKNKEYRFLRDLPEYPAL